MADAAYVFGSLGLDILIAALCGAIGGLGLDLLQEKGLEAPHSLVDNGVRFWNFGFVAPMLIGALAAVIAYALNPPGAGETQRFIGITLAAGVGGQAILKSYINGQIAHLNETRAETAKASLQSLQSLLQPTAVTVTAAKAAGQPLAVPPPHPDEIVAYLDRALQTDADLQRRVQRWQ